jgi:hypothetical protein
LHQGNSNFQIKGQVLFKWEISLPEGNSLIFFSSNKWPGPLQMGDREWSFKKKNCVLEKKRGRKAQIYMKAF